MLGTVLGRCSTSEDEGREWAWVFLRDVAVDRGSTDPAEARKGKTPQPRLVFGFWAGCDSGPPTTCRWKRLGSGPPPCRQLTCWSDTAGCQMKKKHDNECCHAHSARPSQQQLLPRAPLCSAPIALRLLACLHMAFAARPHHLRLGFSKG